MSQRAIHMRYVSDDYRRAIDVDTGKHVGTMYAHRLGRMRLGWTVLVYGATHGTHRAERGFAWTQHGARELLRHLIELHCLPRGTR